MARLKAGDMREVGTIKRPTKNPRDGGREGQPETICQDWPFGFASSMGREMVVALQVVPMATHVLTGWDVGRQVSNKDYVEWNGRRLNIEFVDDKHPPNLMLTCVEQAP
jgi:hypothetical protein